MLDALLPADVVCDDLVDAEEPGDRQEACKSPESEPLEEGHYGWWEVLRYLLWKRQRDHHDWEKHEACYALIVDTSDR